MMVNWKKKVSGDDTGTDYGEVFKLFDKDGSGIIGITEVKNFMREMGQTDFTQLEKIFKEIDDDGSGGITEKEFQKLFDAPITRKDFEDAFRLFDKDASGFLSAAELQQEKKCMKIPKNNIFFCILFLFFWCRARYDKHG